MRPALCVTALCLGLAPLPPARAQQAGQPPRPAAVDLKDPRSVVVGPDGRVYVTVTNVPGKEDGAVVALVKGKAVPFATGLDEPRGLASFQQWLFVVDNRGVWRLDRKGKAQPLARADAFPGPASALHDVAVDPESGVVYVSHSGEGGKGGGVYRIVPGKVSRVTDETRWPGLRTPRALAMDGASFLLVTDAGTGELHRVRIQGGQAEKVASGLGSGDGLAWDWHGRLFISDAKNGRVHVIPRPGQKPVALPAKLQAPADLCLAPGGKYVLAADTKAGTVAVLRAAVPGAPVDDTPLPLETAVAFPDLKWTGWSPRDDRGRPTPLRPLVLTHAGDGSGRVFVATQHGVIHVFPNDQKAKETKVFLDIQKHVRYRDDTNEEGFLGLAFHPDYKKNGEFFVFYTLRKQGHVNRLARYRVSKDDPDRADPASEEVLLDVPHPFWNHDGGTVIFGPDGYLYLALGDGGAAGDPFNHAQNLKSLLGKILRLDVNRKDPGKTYAIPKDNPFVGRKDAAPETWAYGLRNVWRMAFDRKTGVLWAADVGQNLFEEIDLIVKGGNYGWKPREGFHPFGPRGSGPKPEYIEPIWEYPHTVGQSITGGTVYRGPRLKELDGHYLYADYVSCKIWALRYDEQAKRVVANRPIRDRNLPIMSFGEDERGEVYLMTYSASGRGIYWFVRTGGKQGGRGAGQ
jgi:glucose/arabinose dehydrogenase/sugar lactone lactonase YvrE